MSHAILFNGAHVGLLIVTVLLWACIFCLAAGTALPLSKIPHGAVRGLAFPREQFFGVAIVALVGSFLLLRGTALFWAIGILVAVMAIQVLYIAKFTPLWSRQSADASDDERGRADTQLTLISANVKLSNRDFDQLIACVRRHDPDIVAAIEVDEEWIGALQDALGDVFAHWVNVPKDTGYGLSLMSRYGLSETEVRELVVKGVPSIRTVVTLPSGDRLRLYVVHPEPPVINHDTKGRDSEIAKVGMEAETDTLPSIVTGDLNDVAWSSTTRRFQRLSGLLDPRVGRGFYNTFHAYMPWMRWPLDHLFHHPRFRLIRMERLEKIGSDHFPMLFSLALAHDEEMNSDPGDCEKDERDEVNEMIEEERAADREAIGTDWEKAD
jgi:endonuclease/exonuclease/phosphatase (EEP) superfamily protein YafD